MSIDNMALENNEYSVDTQENRQTEADAQEKKQKKKQSAIQGLYEYVETFCYALALMILLFMFVFRYVSVDGDSMLYTLHNNDKLVISNLAYTPKTGDIVVIKHSPKPLIKRIIAVGGQRVRIDYENWAIYVDGEKLDEPYVRRIAGVPMAGGAYATDEEFLVDEGKIFVLGDNRNNSKDSREFGLFNESDILGRVIFRVYPNFGKVDNNTGRTADSVIEFSSAFEK
ncbi:MAG TPA: signal peptidase I [Bacillota bacterium]|nr:signal peptidase I [Bacillota bacterium]HOK67965.1 signal peptidase I [Bacillota bacterium]HPP84356.1 signal peptidase I [Bacillota bacterium]